MGERTAIQWSDSTWNPFYGCRRVSPGCTNCYAARDMKRYGRNFDVVTRAAESSFLAPTRWKKGRRIFVCSWSDFFIKAAAPWREQAWEIMLANPQHTYQLLTKRPGLMLYWAKHHEWPRHIWAGTSVESAKYLPRLKLLAQVPAKVRFVSCEPLLESLDLRPWLGELCGEPCECRMPLNGQFINWVIVGGESGPGARPMQPDWARSIRDQCQEAAVSFFLKQNGEWAPMEAFGATSWANTGVKGGVFKNMDGDLMFGGKEYYPRGIYNKDILFRIGRKAAGAILDGREWQEVP